MAMFDNPNDGRQSEIAEKYELALYSIGKLIALGGECESHAIVVKDFIDWAVQNRTNLIRRICYERNKHRKWKQRAVGLGWTKPIDETENI